MERGTAIPRVKEKAASLLRAKREPSRIFIEKGTPMKQRKIGLTALLTLAVGIVIWLTGS